VWIHCDKEIVEVVFYIPFRSRIEKMRAEYHEESEFSEKVQSILKLKNK
jgi:hypothetical protein